MPRNITTEQSIEEDKQFLDLIRLEQNGLRDVQVNNFDYIIGRSLKRI